MIIPINISLNSDSSDCSRPKLPPSLAKLGDAEVVLIELQGTLEVEGLKDKQFIGRLSLVDDKKPTLTIGHHLLEGKYANLPKPFAVLKKAPAGAADIDVEDAPIQNETPEWDMVALVKRKIVFAKRPMPIVNHKPASSST